MIKTLYRFLPWQKYVFTIHIIRANINIGDTDYEIPDIPYIP